MKFKAGQILKHNPSGSIWIVTSINPYADVFPKRQANYRLLVRAYCLYSGNNPDYWQPNQVDHWVMTTEDCGEHDNMWAII